MDDVTNLLPIIITPLSKVEHLKGAIFHGIKVSDSGYVGFGEAYFTTIISAAVKGWKKHQKMTMNLIVPIGKVRFYVYCADTKQTNIYDIGYDNYCRLTVPPGYWLAFRGMADVTSFVLNVSDIEHDPAESINVPLSNFPLPTL